MKIEFERVAFMGAHPDDNCVNCGGIISRLKSFHFYTFSCLNNKRKQEWGNLRNYIQPTSSQIFLFKGNMLPDRRYEIRSELEKIKKKINPDLIFTHTLNSIHQSHATLAEEVERIMRNTTVLGYADTKSCPRFVPTVFIEITEEELEDKIKMVSFIESEKSKYSIQPDLIKSIARVNGAKIGVKYAEAFDVIRMKI